MLQWLKQLQKIAIVVRNKRVFMGFVEPELNLSPKVSDEIRKTTCYMCACRCGIDVHMKNDKVAYIEAVSYTHLTLPTILLV